MNTRGASRRAGFTLLELLVTMAIFGILMAMAIPGIRAWRSDLKIKEQAESVASGLKIARGEALRRNAAVRFNLVANFTAACAPVTNGNHWVVGFGIPSCNRVESLTFACDPAGANASCNNPYAPVASSVLLQTSLPASAAPGGAPTDAPVTARVINAADTVTTTMAVASPGAASDNVLCFFGSGQLGRVNIADGRCTRSQNPATTVRAVASFDVSDPAIGACRHLASATDIARDRVQRCIRVEVSAAGDVRTCDPWVIHDGNTAPDFADPRRCTCERGTATDQRACP